MMTMVMMMMMMLMMMIFMGSCHSIHVIVERVIFFYLPFQMKIK